MTDTLASDYWNSVFESHLALANIVQTECLNEFNILKSICEESLRTDCKIMFFGNGGSAGDAQHIAAEFSVKLCKDRKPMAGLCLSLDPSAITACANDYGYESIFARQIQALGKSGDVAFGLSTSGNSHNVIKALQTARSMGMKTVGFAGRTGGEMIDLCDSLITIPADDTGRIQEMHITIGHILCGVLEKKLGLVA